MGGMSKKNFSIFRKICGDDSLKNGLIVTKMWDEMARKEHGWRRVTELSSDEKFFKPALCKGARRVHQEQDTTDSARAILRQVLQNHSIPLDLQDELVTQRKDLNDTAANRHHVDRTGEAARGGAAEDQGGAAGCSCRAR